ncbi:MAG TPA: hypothetical protein V6D08_03930, partial [Candidatus Obscuribacterales bacterium]
NCSRGRFSAAIKSFYRLSPSEKRNAEICYAAGYAWMRLHRPDVAKGLLILAVSQGFEGYRGWESAGDLLSRISQMEKFAPPHLRTFCDQGNSKIRVYGRQTSWSQPVLLAMPQFVTRAKEIFGEDCPAINFYFFEAREHFENFYSAMFGTRTQKWWHDGTGSFNVVVYCERRRDGAIAGTPGAARTIGNVLHEYGHALCSTYYGDGYLKAVPNWLNEGLADAVAYPFYGELFSQSRKLLSVQERKGLPAPSYKQMCRELYEDPDVRYTFARLMVEELLANEPSRIKRILKEARRAGSFERALKTVTGFEGRYWYRRIAARYWKAHTYTTRREAAGPG